MQRHRHQEFIRFLNAIEAQVPAKKIVHVILGNYAGAMEFVHDQLATGRKLRVLTVVDTFSRFSPVLEPRFTFRGADVVEVLASEIEKEHWGKMAEEWLRMARDADTWRD